ncbi:MAG: hypothetical protein SGBAC_002687 [Bacillariaceae sp.]
MVSALIQSIDNIPSRDSSSSNDDVPGAVAVSSHMEELRPRLLTQDMAQAADLSDDSEEEQAPPVSNANTVTAEEAPGLIKS